jgi:hypothetical protein
VSKLAGMWLACSQNCGSRLFRALFTEVDIDAEGTYQDHRIVQPGYLCLGCGAPAFDLGEVPAERAAEDEERLAEEAGQAVDVLCPTCETLVTIVPGEECPACGTPLEVA